MPLPWQNRRIGNRIQSDWWRQQTSSKRDAVCFKWYAYRALSCHFKILTLISELDKLKSSLTNDEISAQLRSAKETVTFLEFLPLQLSDPNEHRSHTFNYSSHHYALEHRSFPLRSWLKLMLTGPSGERSGWEERRFFISACPNWSRSDIFHRLLFETPLVLSLVYSIFA